MSTRLLIPSTALLWGLQFAFLNPALALLLTTLFNASTAEVGWSLALYNASALVATTVIPARADRTGQYLKPMLVSATLTILLSALLAITTSLPLAVAALIVLGGPAGVGSTLLFAHLRHAGATPGQVINTRALFSVAWVAGPPIATFIIGTLGEHAAGLEIPALLIMARLANRFSAQALLVSSCLIGVVYYAALFAVQSPAALIGIQVLNAWSFAAIAGTGLTMFQQIIARPGLATSLYMNARRIGAILSGPVIALGSATVLGQAGIFLVCAVLTLAGTVGIAVAHRRPSMDRPAPATDRSHP